MSTPNTPQQQPSSHPQNGPQAPQPTQQPPQGYSQPAQPSYAQPYVQSTAQHSPQVAAQPYSAPRPAPAPGSTTLGQTNTYAFLAIIFAFLSPLVGIIFGHMALSQIKRTGDLGRGIGLTGLIISYAYFAFALLFIILYVGFFFALIGSLGSLGASMSSPDSFDY